MHVLSTRRISKHELGMFPRKVPNAVFNAKPNLKPSSNASLIKPYFSRYNFKFNAMKITEMFKNFHEVRTKIRTVIENVRILQSLRNTILTIPRNLKHQSAGALRVWAHQAECVVAQRLRRSQQMFSLYTKLWEERALKALLASMRYQITKRSKEFVCSAIGLAAYNWNDNRISYSDLQKHLNELDYIHILTEKTMICDLCKLEMRKATAPNLNLCHCGAKQPELPQYENWVPFIEKEDMLVWRKVVQAGQYEYKVYGSYNDVTAEDFLNVQIDCDYRKKWDNTAVRLEVVEKDPVPLTNSDIIYWEMQWPKFFSNRDYVFSRRFVVDWEKKTIVIISRGTNHPKCPLKPDKYRVEDYWSYMVIKPYTELDKPGIEFGLTYFDNPGVNIPSTVTSWVAMRAMPDFLARLRIATKEYKKYCQTAGTKCVFDLKLQRDIRDLQPEEEEIITDNTVYDPVPKFPARPKSPFEICNEQLPDNNNLPVSSDLADLQVEQENKPNVPSEVSNKHVSMMTPPTMISGFEMKKSTTSTQSENENRNNIKYWKPNFS